MLLKDVGPAWFTIAINAPTIKQSPRRDVNKMELKFSGSVQDLPASDRLELLVDAVTDYAIYLFTNTAPGSTPKSSFSRAAR